MLLNRLADGHFHSGRELGDFLGVTRAAVWKIMRALTESGVEVQAVRGRGYRLAHAFEPLREETIRAHLSAPARELLAGVEIHSELDSTNRYLLQAPASPADGGWLCLAERQSAGRGRRGRQWVSVLGGSLTGSLRWRFDMGGNALRGLSLALGVAVLRALHRFGVRDAGIKWPNDILWHGAKLAGILVEMRGEADGPCELVVGIGINARLPRQAMSDVEQAWVDLHGAIGEQCADRNLLTALLLNELLPLLHEFPSRGAGEHLAEWSRHDLFYGRDVVVHTGQGEVRGIARGVEDDGALLLECGGVMQKHAYGEVSLRGA